MRRIANQDREDDDYQNQAEEWREAIKPDASDVRRRRIGGYVSCHQCRSDLFRKGRRAMTEYTSKLKPGNAKLNSAHGRLADGAFWFSLIVTRASCAWIHGRGRPC